MEELLSILCAASFLLMMVLLIPAILLQIYVSLRIQKHYPQMLEKVGPVGFYLKDKLQRYSDTTLRPFDSLIIAKRWRRAVTVVGFVYFTCFMVSSITFFMIIAKSR